jgi:hypothetical protein
MTFSFWNNITSKILVALAVLEQTSAKPIFSRRKLILFVDGSNLYHSIKQIGLNPSSVNYHKLFSLIAREPQPVVRFYSAPKRFEQGLEQRAAQQSFFESLKKNPNLSIHLGKLQCKSSR